MNGKENKITKL